MRHFAIVILLILAGTGTAMGEDPPRVRIAVLDSGIDASHPEFGPGQVVAWKDFLQGKPDPYDDHGHGTATASLAAGLNRASCGDVPKISFAPGAPLIVGKVLDDRNGLPSRARLAEAVDWAVAQGAGVISLSIGSSTEVLGPDDAAVGQAVERAPTFACRPCAGPVGRSLRRGRAACSGCARRPSWSSSSCGSHLLPQWTRSEDIAVRVRRKDRARMSRCVGFTSQGVV